MFQLSFVPPFAVHPVVVYFQTAEQGAFVRSELLAAGILCGQVWAPARPTA